MKMNRILLAFSAALFLASCTATQSMKLANDSVHIKYERASVFLAEPDLEDMREEAVKRCATDEPTLVADTCSWNNGFFCYAWTFIYDCRNL